MDQTQYQYGNEDSVSDYSPGYYLVYGILILLFLTLSFLIDVSCTDTDEQIPIVIDSKQYVVIKHSGDDGETTYYLVDIPDGGDVNRMKSQMNNNDYRFMLISDPMDNSRTLNGINKYNMTTGRATFVPNNSKESDLAHELRYGKYKGRYKVLYMTDIEKGSGATSRDSMSEIPKHHIFIRTSH